MKNKPIDKREERICDDEENGRRVTYCASYGKEDCPYTCYYAKQRALTNQRINNIRKMRGENPLGRHDIWGEVDGNE